MSDIFDHALDAFESLEREERQGNYIMNHTPTEQEIAELNQGWMDSYGSQEQSVSTSTSKSKDPVEHTYYDVLKSTPKSKFYVTSETPLMGFWCPKSAIVEDDTVNNVVHIEHWCDINIIEWNVY